MSGRIDKGVINDGSWRAWIYVLENIGESLVLFCSKDLFQLYFTLLLLYMRIF